jgi:hypothetical protein
VDASNKEEKTMLKIVFVFPFTNNKKLNKITARAKTHASNPFKILKKFRNDCVTL